jgi:transposase
MYFAGVDWASRQHAICVVNVDGAIVLAFEVEHTETGIAQLVGDLQSFPDLSIAIERPDGVLVDALLESGYRVVPIHPNILKATRSRHRIAGKSDPGDAYILADLLRTDHHRFKALQPHTPEVKALRMLTRSRKDLVKMRVATSNQLFSLLEANFPGATRIFGKLDSLISLAFLREYPTQSAAERLTETGLGEFLRRHSYSGRRSAAELFQRLRSAPPTNASELQSSATQISILAYVSVLEQVVAQIASLKLEIVRCLKQIPSGAIVQSFPGAGEVNAAMLISKIGQDPRRFSTAEQLISVAGVAPVTYASGKQRGVAFRRHCDQELRDAVTCLANASRKRSRWAAEVYRRARERGCDHPHAIRILGRSWLRVLWRCWRDGALYDPQLHGEAVKVGAGLAA